MDFLPQDLLQPTVIQTVFVISLVSVIGIYLGRIKVGGISLGITFVFFVGIIAAYLGVTLNPDMLGYAQNFGLILFVYTLGLEVGPGFFSSFKKGGVTLNMLCIALILAGTLMALGLWAVTPLPLSEIMGLLSGAVTNTPMLGAAQQTLLQMDPRSAEAADMAMSCAVAYPMGVVGMIVAIIVLRWIFKKFHKPIENKEDKDTTFIGEYVVSNPAVFEKTIGEVMKLLDVTIVISRIWHDGNVRIPAGSMHLHEGDHLMVVSDRHDTDRITALFGQMVPKDWNSSDIDWNAIDREVVCREIYVTEDKLNGVRLGSLKLRNAYGINITRVNRAGIMLVASRDLILQLGDKLTIVGDAKAIDNVANLLGNHESQLDTPNLPVLFIGLALGVLAGAIGFSIPGMSMPVRLGIAGGPILVGILLGAFGPRFHLTTYTTHSASLILRQFGIITYLAGLGLSSGAGFFDKVLTLDGLVWLAMGFIMAVVPVLLVGVIAMKRYKLDFTHCVGMLCGTMANPMALTYAETTGIGEEAPVAYATVYPVTMFLRVIIAQIVMVMFC